MEKLILITSNDKDPAQSSTNSDFTVELKEKYNTQNIRRVLVKDIQVPNVFYNVRSSQGVVNNSFTFTETGQATQTVTVPEGQYTTTTLITALKTAIDAVLVAGVVTITQSALTQKLLFSFSVGTATIYSASDPTNPNLMANVLGIGTSTAVPAANITADYIPDLQGIQMVYIHSQAIAEAHAIDAGKGLISVIEDVSFHNVPFGGMAFRQNNDDELALIEYSQPRNLSTIRIVLRDDKGNKLDIGTNKISIILKAFYAR